MNLLKTHFIPQINVLLDDGTVLRCVDAFTGLILRLDYFVPLSVGTVGCHLDFFISIYFIYN